MKIIADIPSLKKQIIRQLPAYIDRVLAIIDKYTVEIDPPETRRSKIDAALEDANG